jgi:hypothetical protein
MVDISPWVLTCGLLCVWPFLAMLFGIWIGRNRIRIRSPFTTAQREVYAPDPHTSSVIRRIAQEQAQQKGS